MSFFQVVWMHEVLKLKYSVFFVDLDVVLLRNPLPWLVATFPDADMAISTEVCQPWASFPGDYVKWKPGDVFVQNIGQVGYRAS